jgi:tetratricopeptide (TPR) repeat protein
VGRVVARIGGARPLLAGADPEVARLVAAGDEAARRGRRDEARDCYRRALERRRHDIGALRGLRALAVQDGAWRDALAVQERLLSAVPAAERAGEQMVAAGLHYELGRAEDGHGRSAAAIAHFRAALKIDRGFVPAAVALGDALEAAGDRREAVRTWERAAEIQPALPVLARLERVYREDGRPSRMIALYRAALERAPDDLGLAVALGRVYLELEMLDEAADQFEKVEVRAPEHPAVHAYLGAVFERRGETREAFAEYRRALRLAGAFEWTHRCSRCGATAAGWHARCARCGEWNTLRPSAER